MTDAELLAEAEGVLREAEHCVPPARFVRTFDFSPDDLRCPRCAYARRDGHAPGCELYRVLGAIKKRRGDRGS